MNEALEIANIIGLVGLFATLGHLVVRLAVIYFIGKIPK